MPIFFTSPIFNFSSPYRIVIHGLRKFAVTSVGFLKCKPKPSHWIIEASQYWGTHEHTGISKWTQWVLKCTKSVRESWGTRGEVGRKRIEWFWSKHMHYMIFKKKGLLKKERVTWNNEPWKQQEENCGLLYLIEINKQLEYTHGSETIFKDNFTNKGDVLLHLVHPIWSHLNFNGISFLLFAFPLEFAYKI